MWMSKLGGGSCHRNQCGPQGPDQDWGGQCWPMARVVNNDCSRCGYFQLWHWRFYYRRVTVGPYAHIRPGSTLQRMFISETLSKSNPLPLGKGPRLAIWPIWQCSGRQDVLRCWTISTNVMGKNKFTTTIGDKALYQQQFHYHRTADDRRPCPDSPLVRSSP